VFYFVSIEFVKIKLMTCCNFQSPTWRGCHAAIHKFLGRPSDNLELIT